MAERRLDEELRDLARRVETPAPSADLADRVLARLSAEPVPRSRLRAAVGDLRGRSVRGIGWASALLAALLLGLLLGTPVGATVAEWFDFHGIVVDRGADDPEPTGTPTAPPVDGHLDLAEAAALVDFTPRVPDALGEPDAVGVDQAGRLLSMSWGTGADTVRLDQFDGRTAPVFRKSAADAEPVAVGSAEGLWFPTPHELTVLAPEGDSVTLAPRLAARTLIWESGGITFRLEGGFSRDAAVALAASVR